VLSALTGSDAVLYKEEDACGQSSSASRTGEDADTNAHVDLPKVSEWALQVSPADTVRRAPLPSVRRGYPRAHANRCGGACRRPAPKPRTYASVTCHLCGRVYTREFNRTRHLKEHHLVKVVKPPRQFVAVSTPE
jgi:hypothetical protein